MKKIVFLIMPLIWLTSCGEAPAERDIATALRPTKLYTVQAFDQAREYRLFARIANRETIDLKFEVAGQLAALPIHEGEKIKRGDLIAELDASEHKLALDRANASLTLARQEHQRLETLHAKGILSTAELDEAKTRHQLLRIGVAEAREVLKDCVILAPFDALIVRRFKPVHSAVIAGDAVVRLTRADTIELLADVPEKLVTKIQKNGISRAYARFSADPDSAWPVTLIEQNAQVNPTTLTYETRFTLDRIPEWNPLQGMTAQLSLALPSIAQQLLVPTAALQTDVDGSFFVWVTLPPDYRVAKRLVKVGTPSSGMLPITLGLAVGETVVAAGGSALRAGQKIRPINQSATHNND